MRWLKPARFLKHAAYNRHIFLNMPVITGAFIKMRRLYPARFGKNVPSTTGVYL
jgi:hypothetical protein